MYFTQHYVIDWDKVKTFEDMKRILQVLSITFDPSCQGLDKIGDLVRLEDKRPTITTMNNLRT